MYVYVCVWRFIGSRTSKWDDELQVSRPNSMVVKVPKLLPMWVKYLQSSQSSVVLGSKCLSKDPHLTISSKSCGALTLTFEATAY